MPLWPGRRSGGVSAGLKRHRPGRALTLDRDFERCPFRVWPFDGSEQFHESAFRPTIAGFYSNFIDDGISRSGASAFWPSWAVVSPRSVGPREGMTFTASGYSARDLGASSKIARRLFGATPRIVRALSNWFNPTGRELKLRPRRRTVPAPLKLRFSRSNRTSLTYRSAIRKLPRRAPKRRSFRACQGPCRSRKAHQTKYGNHPHEPTNCRSTPRPALQFSGIEARKRIPAEIPECQGSRNCDSKKPRSGTSSNYLLRPPLPCSRSRTSRATASRRD